MQWSLFLLVLMGECFSSSCHLYEYHLIETKKSWKAAQAYCRENHTDLATVFDMSDIETLKTKMERKNVDAAWIGLHSKEGKINRKWHWSLPGVEDNKKHWDKMEPSDGGGKQNCAGMIKNGKWHDIECKHSNGFICYNDGDLNQPVKVIDDKKNWTQAQKTCRKDHTDLISGLDQLKHLNHSLMSSNNDLYWIGLFRDTWRWSDGSSASFRNWPSGEFKDGVDKAECASVLSESGEWNWNECEDQKPFFCYDGECFSSSCRPYKYQLIETEKSWKDAQAYCRKYHTDLATVFDMSDIETLKTKMERKNVDAAWIGLHSKEGKINRKWHWSLPGVEDNKKHWDRREPNDGGGKQNCAGMIKNGKWHDLECEHSKGFICYNDGDLNQPVKVIDAKKSWTQAQKTCRKHHTDLISGLDQLNRLNLSLINRFYWIGLFRDTWRWSDGSSASFRNWPSEEFKDGVNKTECASVLSKSGEWNWNECEEQKPFFCYNDTVILIQKKMNWLDALDYCRENHEELATIRDVSDQRWVQDRAKNATTSHVWLGLRYTCTLDFWFWVSDEAVDYENWAKGQEEDKCNLSGAMSSNGTHEWDKKLDHEEFDFICSKV